MQKRNLWKAGKKNIYSCAAWISVKAKQNVIFLKLIVYQIRWLHKNLKVPTVVYSTNGLRLFFIHKPVLTNVVDVVQTFIE